MFNLKKFGSMPDQMKTKYGSMGESTKLVKGPLSMHEQNVNDEIIKSTNIGDHRI